MVLLILFWIFLILYAVGALVAFPPKAQHVILCVLLAILGLKTFGNPLNG